MKKGNLSTILGYVGTALLSAAVAVLGQYITDRNMVEVVDARIDDALNRKIAEIAASDEQSE